MKENWDASKIGSSSGGSIRSFPKFCIEYNILSSGVPIHTCMVENQRKFRKLRTERRSKNIGEDIGECIT